MQPQGSRQSPYLKAIETLHEQLAPKGDYILEPQAPLSPPTSSKPEGIKRPQILPEPSTSSRKRKRGQEDQEVEYQEGQQVGYQEEQEAGFLSPRVQEQSPFKQPPTSSPSSTTAAIPRKKEVKLETERPSDIIETADPVQYWTFTKRWPKEFFESQGDTWEDLEQDSWLEEQMDYSIPSVKYVVINGFRLPCPVKKLPSSLRRKKSDSSLTETCDQTNREGKSVPYRNPQYTTLLEAKGSYMYESDLGIKKESKDLYHRLLELPQTVPEDSLFRDDLFAKTCRKIENRNEAKVIQDIARLIVPSVETLATYGARHLEHLIEGVNEAWLGNMPIEGPRPQPDYFVGFRRSAFTDEQLKKLDPLIGSVFENSFFTATYRMYFPFFTCEVKCGTSALDIADRQNAHSMTVAVRAFIVLLKSVGRQNELNRQILAFSISHDHDSVRIYGHYAVIENDKITFYRHPIHKFSFTTLDGKEKWTTYKFTKNLYDHYVPKIHKLICSAIDDLPAGISFDLSQSASFTQSTTSQVNSILGDDDNQSSSMTSQKVTPTTSFDQPTETEPAFKKPKNQ